jgi:hypothetical protein
MGRLYHATVPLQTSTASSRLYVIGLDPPGNVSRELALYRRSLFATLLEPSARAFPDMAPLLFARRRPRARSGEKGGAFDKGQASSMLAEAWQGIEGGFGAGRPSFRDGLLYLGIEGPGEELSRALGARLESLDLETCRAPISAGQGFFLLKARDGPRELAAAELAPPSISFFECRMALYRMDFGLDPFIAMSWKEIAFSWRPRGAKAADRRLPV